MKTILNKVLLSFSLLLFFTPNMLCASPEDAQKLIPVIQLLLLSDDTDTKAEESLTNPIINKVKNSNFKNLLGSTKALSKDNYITYYKRMSTLKFINIPSLKVTFDLKKSKYKTTQSKNKNPSNKVIYQSIWSRKDESACRSGGTVSKDVSLFPRGHFEADTYKTGDTTIYDYYGCDTGDATYNGKVEYSVGTSNSGVNDIHFDSTFGATPLGTFDSQFRHLSIETASQKVTLNGTIRYNAKSRRAPEPNSKLISLEKKYYTSGNFEITVYDKTTGDTTKLIYNGTLEKLAYRESSGITDSDASVINLGILGNFTYRRTSSYTLNIESSGKMAVLGMYDNISGVIGADGRMQAPRPVEYDYSNSAALYVSDHRILHMVLADGTSRYILDENTDWFPEANEIDGTPQHTLPPSDVDLMQGVVVIGFDTCVPTNRIRQQFDELGIPYNYVNIYATEKEYGVFKWFRAIGVPYVGINGNFFGGAVYDLDNYIMKLNLSGYDMDDSVVNSAQQSASILNSATVYFKKRFDDLQTKERHTAMAVANDIPYRYTTYRAWNWSTAQKAIDHALVKCEERRKARVDNGKKEIKSQCRVYSVDGIKRATSSVRDMPE